ncbi:PadR family transcriptional regulator [Deinococcus sp. Arct2-2]|uniref:PadR family transcriptional regulator n=1 Tax=Deinococcus sp. Arct2-2 TaxID=2568653 RepID=UPI0010A2CF1A|nr:helix-turn-helix transcriptional regulator [Deinococcus sp. Arct2-2]THF68004.1 PadR family transcriptional regulator [Deinococcus sp. Arct2-2]
MPPREQLHGHLDLILLTLLEPEPLYGLRIAQEAQRLTDGYFDFKEGSLYPALHRLERAGFLQAEDREVGRNGRPRKYYCLTPSGRTELTARQREWAAFRQAMARLEGQA